MTQKHKPTAEQELVIGSMGSSESIMVEALAGTAKTTTLEMSAPQIKVPALALAFNKKIATEMQGRFPQNFSVKTLNALGHMAWARALPAGTRLVLDDRKLGKLVSQVAKDRKIDLHGDQWDALRRLVTAGMQAGLVPNELGPAGFVPDDLATWIDIGDQIGILPDETEFLLDLARDILRQSIDLAKRGTISFDDQIYCSVMLGGVFPQFPVVFVDEAQDLSPLNHEMLRLVLRPAGKLVAVGDEKQAIYAFRGASGDSLDRIRKLKPKWATLGLKTTFRCPKVIVERQQGHAPGYVAWPSNPDGRVIQLQGPRPKQNDLDDPNEGQEPYEWGWEDIQGAMPWPRASIAILCRNNGPLFSMAMKLLRKQIGVTMLGRDIGKGLMALTRKLAPQDELPADLVMGKIREWEETESSRAIAGGHEERVAGIVDRAECLYAIIEGAGCRDAGELRTVLEKLFASQSGQVTLGSIHRSKGLEFDLVVHLDPWRIPSRWAKKSADPVALRQEYNLKYVCETRTRHTLVLANVEDFR